MRNLLVLFHVDSKFLQHLWLLDQFFTNPATTGNCDSCHWSSDGVLVSLLLLKEESTTVVSLDEKLVFHVSIWFNNFRVWCTIRLYVDRTE